MSNMEERVKATIGGREVTLGDDAMVETTRAGERVRYRAVVDVQPRSSEDGSHRHISRRSDSGRALLAVRPDGEGVRLEWVDTDEVSHCPSGCDGDHETWYVQELRCPLCGAVLTTTTGEDEVWVGRGVDYRLRCSLHGAAPEGFDAPLVVSGLADEPLSFRGQWEIESSFDGQCFRFDGVAHASA